MRWGYVIGIHRVNWGFQWKDVVSQMRLRGATWHDDSWSKYPLSFKTLEEIFDSGNDGKFNKYMSKGFDGWWRCKAEPRLMEIRGAGSLR